MAEPTRPLRRKRALAAVLSWLVVGCSALLVTAAIMLPSRALSWLRRHYPAFSTPLRWLEHHSGPFNVIHVILFGWMALLLSWLCPKVRWWRLSAALLALAIASELAQILVPGRHPRASDVLDDLLGVAIGMALAGLLRWILRGMARAGSHI